MTAPTYAYMFVMVPGLRSQILDLRGTTKAEQNDLLDSFLTITSTKSDLESTSFLTSLDMDPGQSSSASNQANRGGAFTTGEGILAALASPPGAATPVTGTDTPPRDGTTKREVFQDFKRFVSFGLRRESMPPS